MEIYAYCKIGGIGNSEILGISTIEDYDMTTRCIIDGDTAIDFSKLEGYYVYSDEFGYNHLAYDEEKYKAYLAQKEIDEANAEKQEAINQVNEELLNLISVTEEESDKEGFKFKVYKIGDLVVKKEYIEIPMVNDGSDYTKPLTYEVGMEVVEGLWYTDGSNVWECIKSGTPTSFEDKEYFDIVEV